MEQVTVQDQTEVWAGFGIHGPEAARIVTKVVQLTSDGGLHRTSSRELEALQEHQHLVGRYDGLPVIVVRSNEIGEVGFSVYTEAARADEFGHALSEAGAEALDVETFDLLRLEAGRPVFPTDMDQDTIPLEAGIEDRAINLNKGCYVGQEVIVRILHRGQGRVARRLVGLSFDLSDVTPTAGDALTTPDDPGGEPIGVLTSVGRSPVLERAIAFGYVKRELAKAGTELVVLGLEHPARGVVTVGPFLKLPRFG
jgi:folate-binding protein YgfZ